MPLELADTATATEEERLLQAEGLVRAYCRWHIAPSRAEDVVVDGSGARLQALPTLHLTDVTAVLSDGDAVTDFSWSAAGILSRPGRWSREYRGVKATIVHGFTEPPAEVTAIVQSIASRALAAPDGVVRRQVGLVGLTYSQTGFNQTVPIALLDAEREVLNHYRLPSLS